MAEVTSKFAAELGRKDAAGKDEKAERREKDAVRTDGDQIVAMRRMDSEDFINAVPPAHRSKLLPFAAILLQMHTVWLDSTALRSHYFVRDSFPDASAESKLQFVWRAVMLLERLSVGLCGITTNPYGPKPLLAVKRPVPTEDGLARRTFLDVLRVLGVDLAAPWAGLGRDLGPAACQRTALGGHCAGPGSCLVAALVGRSVGRSSVVSLFAQCFPEFGLVSLL